MQCYNCFRISYSILFWHNYKDWSRFIPYRKCERFSFVFKHSNNILYNISNKLSLFSNNSERFTIQKSINWVYYYLIMFIHCYWIDMRSDYSWNVYYVGNLPLIRKTVAWWKHPNIWSLFCLFNCLCIMCIFVVQWCSFWYLFRFFSE